MKIVLGAVLALMAAVAAGESVRAQHLAASAAPWPDQDTMKRRSEEAAGRRLFADSGVIDITLSADFKTVNKDRDPSSVKTFPATITVPDASNAPVVRPLQIRTRGHVRRMLRTCEFAPLRLEFDLNQIKDTLLAGHKNIKLGTHCRDNDEFAEYVPREYSIYRMYNLLTPNSFRARMVRVKYADPTGKELVTRLGLFIEDDDDVARRMEGRILDEEKVTFRRTDIEATTLMALFEYAIGNTDLSIYALHNVRLVQRPSRQLHPVPYDFDYSGIVNARYAVPAKQFNLKSVRERLYLGPCRPLELLQPHFDKFASLKSEFMNIYDTTAGLSDSYRKDAKGYLSEFFQMLDHPKDLKRAFVDGCGNRAGI